MTALNATIEVVDARVDQVNGTALENSGDIAQLNGTLSIKCEQIDALNQTQIAQAGDIEMLNDSLADAHNDIGALNATVQGLVFGSELRCNNSEPEQQVVDPAFSTFHHLDMADLTGGTDSLYYLQWYFEVVVANRDVFVEICLNGEDPECTDGVEIMSSIEHEDNSEAHSVSGWAARPLNSTAKMSMNARLMTAGGDPADIRRMRLCAWRMQ